MDRMQQEVKMYAKAVATAILHFYEFVLSPDNKSFMPSTFQQLNLRQNRGN
jgi:hypothetical protein